MSSTRRRIKAGLVKQPETSQSRDQRLDRIGNCTSLTLILFLIHLCHGMVSSINLNIVSTVPLV